MQPYTKLGPWIKHRRKALDLTQDALARKIGYAVSTVRKIEAGDLRPSREVAERLAACLEIPAAELPSFFQIARLAHASDQEAPKPAPPSIAYRPLPSGPIALIGREREVSYIRRQLQQPAMRLVTLIGPPGIGKTRLAIAAAATLEDEFPNGICYVPLESVTDPDSVLAAISEALDVREQPARTLAQSIQAAIRQQRLLLVLDNLEHVLAAGRDIATLLQACPRLKILATSRALLHLSGEQGIPVLPLTKPPLSPLPPWESLEIYDSIQLFVSCARLVQPAFRITAQNAAAVATICARLDGLPLAIELIASRIKILQPQLLLERLETLIEAAQTKQADRPARQHTLRAAIEWSYRLLSSQEQRMFCRLGIFEGGATLEVVEAIYAALGDDPGQVMELIERLLDHSMVQNHHDWHSEPRFTMLTILREYALEHLELSGERARLQEAHARFYLGIAEAAQAKFRSPEEQHWLDKLAQEQDNLRAVLQWGIDTGNPAATLRLAGMIWRFWMLRGHVSEGRRWLGLALAIPAQVDAAIQAGALHAAGALASIQAEYEQALGYYDQCIALRRSLNDHAGLATTLLNYGSVARQQGDYPLAEAMLSESMNLYVSLQDLQGVAMALTELGQVVQGQGEYETSAICYREALDIQRQLGNKFATANLLALQGTLEQAQQRYEPAAALYKEAIDAQRTIGDLQSITRPLDGLASMLFHEGNMAEARAYWLECLNHAVSTEKPQFAVKALEGFAQLAGEMGQPEHAARLWALTRAIRASIRYPVPPLIERSYQQAQERARSRVEAAAWAAAWDEGAAMSMDQAVTLVFSEL